MAFNYQKQAQSSKAPEPPKGPKPGSGPGGKSGGRKRIKDRGIDWKEQYGEKSDSLKRRFDKMIGPAAYMRWEGHDYTTNGDYFVVVGPAITSDQKKRFFAGIKRLPDDPDKLVYSPSGEYFSNSHAAFSHAQEKWGISFPQGVPNYPESVLTDKNIPRHVKG